MNTSARRFEHCLERHRRCFAAHANADVIAANVLLQRIVEVVGDTDVALAELHDHIAASQSALIRRTAVDNAADRIAWLFAGEVGYAADEWPQRFARARLHRNRNKIGSLG